MTFKHKIIGLSGKLGAGKNYIAEKIIAPYFTNNYNILIIGFGDQVKQELYARDPELTYDLLYDYKTHETRQKLQQYATENGRDKYNEDMWIRGLDMQIETFQRRSCKDTLIIVCDVRFINEADYIKSKQGLLFRIEAPLRTQSRYWNEAGGNLQIHQLISNHASEKNLDNYKFDYIIHNDTSIDTNFLNTML